MSDCRCQMSEISMRKYLAAVLTCLAFAGLSVQTAFSQSADQPTIQKDSLQVTAWTNNSYKGNFDVWSWVPKFEFKVNGPGIVIGRKGTLGSIHFSENDYWRRNDQEFATLLESEDAREGPLAFAEKK